MQMVLGENLKIGEIYFCFSFFTNAKMQLQSGRGPKVSHDLSPTFWWWKSKILKYSVPKERTF
jgi:hypothetical protein